MQGKEPPPHEGLGLAVERDGSGAVVALSGDLEFATAAQLRNAIAELAREGCDPLVVDVRGVGFVDSTGLSLLVQAMQRVESAGKRFVLRHPSDRLLRLLDVAGLAQLFTVE